MSMKKNLLTGALVALLLLNVGSVTASPKDGDYVYKSLAEATKDAYSSDEIPHPYGASLNDIDLNDYIEKQRVKQDIPIVKELTEANPALYSGFYYNPDKGTLVIQMIQDSQEFKNQIDRSVKNNDKIEYQITKYSKQDIDDAKEKIKATVPGGTVKALIPDTINNTLIVILNDAGSEEKVLAAVSKRGLIQIDRGTVEAEKQADNTDYGSSIPSGALIGGNYQTSGGVTTYSRCTAGYYGTVGSGSNSKRVLVTAGHCVPKNTTTAWYQPTNSTSTIGNFTYRTSSSNPNGSDAVSDSGYIELNSSHNGYPRVPYTSMVRIVGTYVSDTVGDTIYARGAVTGSLTSGTIRYANVDIWWGSDGYGYNDNQVLATGYTSVSGDSGGPIVTDYAWDNSRQAWTFDLAGTHSGQYTFSGHSTIANGTYKVYDPIWMTYNDLNMTSLLMSP
ncbi:hypothetical protein [Paenibacillus chungangensis]|uniref:Peptidase S1 domain-containing protein n=1 Tax=Paenibacillus chungangensis TaxID=696535 RepID=A0ABW3HVG7_9BACL